MQRTSEIFRGAIRGLLLFPLFAGVLLAGVSACAPALNWREVNLGQGVLKALMPCRPDEATRPQSLAGRTVDVQMMGCRADGRLFVLAATTEALPDKSNMQAAQQQWEQTVRQGLAATEPATAPTNAHIKGEPWARAINLCGHTPEQTRWCASAVWFEHRGRLFHAAVYGPKPDAELADTFYAGLELK